ncbi:MAG: hypothetical protein R3D00_10655 [Bacteroidia bacterium]
MQKKQLNIILSIMINLFLISCQQSHESIIQPKKESNSIAISVHSGILAFENWQDFYKLADSLGNLSKEKRRSWESQHGFISRASIFENILEAEEQRELEYYRTYLDQGYNDDQIVALGIPKPKHSELYLEARSKNEIIIYEDSDTASTYTINSPIAHATCLSAEGFVIVGDTLSLLLRGSIRHWIDGEIENRHYLFRVTNSNFSSGILVANTPENGNQRSAASWGSASYFYRWVYEAGSNPKRRAAYQLRGWATDYSIPNPTDITIEHWFELYAQKKSFGEWAARSSYRPNFHIAGNWVHKFGKNDPHGCNINYSVYSSWSNGNNSHNNHFLSPIVDEIVPADNFAWQYEFLYPHGIFQVMDGFCELFRVTQMDVNVHAVGDGGGTLDLVRHLYSE